MKIETSFLTLLGLLFIGLKLGKVINWSWWFILLPIYGPIGIFFAICFFIILVALVAKVFE